MDSHGRREELSSLRDYLRVLRLRKWVIILPAILVPLVSMGVASQKPKLYQAAAEVFVSRQTANLASAISGLPDPSLYEDPDRTLRTQVDLARAPEVARRVLKRASVRHRTAADLLGSSNVTPKADVDLLIFRVTDRDPAVATKLATAYAIEFTHFRQDIATNAFAEARADIQGRLDELRDNGRAQSVIFADLSRKLDQLRTVEALQTSNTVLSRPAGAANQVEPRPIRSGVLGLGLGLLFGCGLALLWHALDTRVRSPEEVSHRLGLPLLGRLSTPPRGLRRKDRIAMLEEPGGVQAEAFRLIRTNLEFVNLDNPAQTIMFTSAIQAEGKSTTLANLGVAFARMGRRVILVDLDLRRPYLDRFFGLDHEVGLTDVVLGHVDLEDALTPIEISGSEPERMQSRNGTRKAVEGSLAVLASGPVPPDPGEFVETAALMQTLLALRERADLILVDAPPLLGVGDTMSLSAKVDGLVVVTRLNVLRRPMLHELERVLRASPAQKLGFVLTGMEAAGGYGYGSYYYQPRETRTKARVGRGATTRNGR